MQVLQRSYRGFSLMIEVNADRLLFSAAMAGALLLGAYLSGF